MTSNNNESHELPYNPEGASTGTPAPTGIHPNGLATHTSRVEANATCDRHPTAKAVWVVEFMNGQLYLCNHCLCKHSKGNKIQSSSLGIAHV